MRRSRFHILPTALALTVQPYTSSWSSSMAWPLNSLSSSTSLRRNHPAISPSPSTSESVSSQVDHFNARSKVRRLTSSTIPLLESSSSSEILELSNNNHRDHVNDDNGVPAASYETWGDGNLLSALSTCFYSSVPSIRIEQAL